MATSTYILTIDDFTDRTDLSPNISQDFLRGYWASAQEQALVAVICQQTYDEIIDELAQGGESYLSPQNQALLPFIKDFLVWATMFEYYPIADVKSTPAGMRKHTDTISEQANTNEIDVFVKRAEANRQFYNDKLINFLEDNKDTYTLWRDSRCNCYQFTKTTGQFQFSSKKSNKTGIKWT